ILAIKFKPPFSETRRRTGDNYIHHEIYEIIETNTFWDQIKDLVKILTPYCKLLNMFQQNKAHLFEVTFTTQLIRRLERRWNEWEQPILLLSLFYFWKLAKLLLSCMGRPRPKCILSEFNNFCLKNSPFDDKTYQQFEDEDVLSYWCYVKDATNELGLVAYRIFSICVNAASVERLWS
ncbi:17509_t:CDS:2, partial [Cetraspora pellucida]